MCRWIPFSKAPFVQLGSLWACINDQMFHFFSVYWCFSPQYLPWTSFSVPVFTWNSWETQWLWLFSMKSTASWKANLSIHYVLCFFGFWSWHMAYEILVPWPRIEPKPPAVGSAGSSRLDCQRSSMYSAIWRNTSSHSFLRKKAREGYL